LLGSTAVFVDSASEITFPIVSCVLKEFLKRFPLVHLLEAFEEEFYAFL